MSIAYHESGNAVVAFVLGLRLKHVTIKPNKETQSLGHVELRGKVPKWAIRETEPYDEYRARLWYETRIQVLFAGRIAETIHAGKRPVRYSHAGDHDGAFRLAQGLGMFGSQEECSAWLEWLFERTKNQLGLPHVWTAVTALAEQLLERVTIAGPAAHTIIRNALCPVVDFVLDKASSQLSRRRASIIPITKPSGRYR